MAKRLEITGERYGMLVAVERVGRIHNDALWRFRCDCGNMRDASIARVRNGKTQSCGCATVALRSAKRVTHGETIGCKGKGKPRLYTTWTNMKSRCYNPNVEAFRRYGGRGIKVCKEWVSSFENFQDWAFSSGYEPHLTIERRSNDGNYEPGNCTWITKSEQSINRGGKFAKAVSG